MTLTSTVNFISPCYLHCLHVIIVIIFLNVGIILGIISRTHKAASRVFFKGDGTRPLEITSREEGNCPLRHEEQAKGTLTFQYKVYSIQLLWLEETFCRFADKFAKWSLSVLRPAQEELVTSHVLIPWLDTITNLSWEEIMNSKWQVKGKLGHVVQIRVVRLT